MFRPRQKFYLSFLFNFLFLVSYIYVFPSLSSFTEASVDHTARHKQAAEAEVSIFYSF